MHPRNPLGTLIRTLTALLPLALGSSLASAASFILPVEAIRDSAHLDYQAFQEKYPGISLDGGYLADYGYFIRYNHENLYYFFGPIETMTEARVHYADLERIVSEAAWKRPPLSTATIDIIEFSRKGLRNMGDGSEYDDEGNRIGGGERDGGGLAADGTESGADGDQDNNGEGAEGEEEFLSQVAGLGNSRQDQKAGQQRQQGREQQRGQQQDRQQQSSRQQQQQGSGSPSMPMPPQQQGGGGPPGMPQQQDGGGGPPPPSIFEIFRRIFGGGR